LVIAALSSGEAICATAAPFNRSAEASIEMLKTKILVLLRQATARQES
jgi:hypothetical protein